MSDDTVRVGVLSLHNSKETKAILTAVEALDHEPERLRTENTVVQFDDGRADLWPDVDVIANRLLLSNTDQPSEILGLAQTLETIRPMLDSPDATARAAHKTAIGTHGGGHVEGGADGRADRERGQTPRLPPGTRGAHRGPAAGPPGLRR